MRRLDAGRISCVVVASVAVSAGACGPDAPSGPVELGPRPASLQIVPDTATLSVDQTVILVVEARDSAGARLELAPGDIVWSTTEPPVATVNARGIARGRAAGATRVRATVAGESAEAKLTVVSPPDPPTATRSVDGLLVIPPSIDPAAVYVTTGHGRAVPVSADGGFSVEAPAAIESALFAMNGDVPFGMAIATPADTTVAADRAKLAIDARSTAVALVYLLPPFAATPPGIAGESLSLIGAQPELDTLAGVIEAHVGEAGRLPDAGNATFVTRLRAAAEAAVTALGQREVSATAAEEASDRADAATLRGNGIELVLPDNPVVGGSIPILARNWRARDVDLYAVPADTAGRPTIDPATVTDPFAGRVLKIVPADWVPGLSLDDWVRFLRGRAGASEGWVTLEFTPDSPRLLLWGYGAGLAGLAEESVEIAGDERRRLDRPILATSLVNILLPTIEVVTGIGLVDLAVPDEYRRVRAVLESQFVGLESAACFFADGNEDPIWLLWCPFAALISHWKDKYVTWDVIRSALVLLIDRLYDAVGVTLDERMLVEVVDELVLALQVVEAVELVGDLAVSGDAVARSELRQEFDLSYNGVLGAVAIDKVAGDGQHAVPGATLADELVVRVNDAAGQPVKNAWVRWTAEPGHGTPGQPVDTTDVDGLARVRWTLGTDRTTQRLTARLAGHRAAVRFHASTEPPSGRIALTLHSDSGTHVVLVNPDDTSRVRFTEPPHSYGQPAWSPDGTRIAYVGDGTGTTLDDVLVRNLDGSEERRLTDTDDARERDIAWAPGGARIAFVRDDYASSDLGPGLIVLDLDGLLERRLGTSRSTFSWSPDGARIAFTDRVDSRERIIVAATDGNSSDTVPMPDTVWASQPAWSPDGDRIAFANTRNHHIMLVDPDGANLVDITAATGDVHDRRPVWSPDGSRIAFVSSDGESDDLHAMNADGTGRVLLVDVPVDHRVWQHVWSPDGSRIAYTVYSSGSDPTTHVYVVDVDGLDVRRLDGSGTQAEHPAWEPG